MPIQDGPAPTSPAKSEEPLAEEAPSEVIVTENPGADATLQKPRQSIADERARYRWNAAETALSNPAPSGGPVPKMKGVCFGR